MAVFTITTFSTFAGLLLAGQKLATAPDPINGLKALADLATNGKALAAVLTETGLTPLAAEMTRQAEDHARHFTHPGPARDDALAIFWQVAPEAFADPRIFTAGDLDPDRITERMVAAINASPHARDFAVSVLAEPFFRSVSSQTLALMLGKADYIATITPDLWRETLRRHGVEIELLERLDDTTQRTEAKIDTQSAQLARMEAMLERLGATPPGVPEATVIELARRVAPRTEDIDEALGELRRAVDLAAEMQVRGKAGSNVDDFVDDVLRRLVELTGEGRLDEAASAADAAVDRAEAGLAQLLDAAVNQHLLAFDAEGAARQIVRRVTMESPGPGALFGALQNEGKVWYERGRDRGVRLDLEVAIAIARHNRTYALNSNQRGMASNDLGGALAMLGARESGGARLEEAVEAHRAALKERPRARVPFAWATSQNNLGGVLLRLGERERGSARLEQAETAFRAALEEWTRERVPLKWARTQTNLASTLRRLGERESGTARLEEAVVAYREALEEQTRERVPLDWATTQSKLGGALIRLGERENDTARFVEAVAAYRAALEERTREVVPLDWALAHTGLGAALATLGERESGTGRLEEAVAAFDAALEEQTRERVPLDWATTTGSQGATLRVIAQRTGDTAMARRARDQIAVAEAALRAGGHAPYAVWYAGQLPAAEALVARLEARGTG